MPTMKHTDAPTASQGLKIYLATCANSGLPNVLARAEKLADMDAPARMRWYIGKYGEHFEPQGVKVVKDDTIASRRERLLARLGITEGVEMVEDTPAPARTTRRTRRRRNEATIAVGTSFEVKRKNGTWTGRTILGINEDGSLRVRNDEFGVESKRPYRGLERQLASKKARLI